MRILGPQGHLPPRPPQGLCRPVNVAGCGWNDRGPQLHLPLLMVTGPLPLSEQQNIRTASPSRSNVRK